MKQEPLLVLPGVWMEIEPGLFVKQYNNGAAWIEARLNGEMVQFEAKVCGTPGNVAQCVGDGSVKASDHAAIEEAITFLEMRLDKSLQGHSEPVVELLCSCCSSVTYGRQWHNRDDGYGVCPKCVEWMAERESAEAMKRNYGIRGVHYNVARPETAERGQ